MASLEYVMAGWLRSRRLTVASVGAGRGCGGLCPRPLPRQGGGTGARGLFAWWWALGLARWGEALAPLWGEFPSVFGAPVVLDLVGAEPDGWALLSSRVWPSRLSGALLPWSSSFWRSQTNRICGAPLSPRSRRRYWIVPSHQIQSPV